MSTPSGPAQDPPGNQPALADAYGFARLEAPTLRRADIEARTGVDPERSLRWWRAMGFPEVDDDEVAFREEDAAMVRALQALIDAGAIDEADILRLARLLGASFSRLVDAQLDALDSAIINEFDGAEVDIFAFMESSMIFVWRRHLIAAIGQRLTMEKEHVGQAVGFVDLSGFSRVTKRASSAELADLIDLFETTAFDVVSGLGGRVVKLIGDEVMFVTDDLDRGVDIAVELIRRFEATEQMPPVHCGLAFGPTTTVGGDVFGPTVNLASRLTGVARPGSVALPRDDGAHLIDRDDLDVRRIRRSYDLKGIGRTSVIAIRPIA